jgi:hypothetical protein
MMISESAISRNTNWGKYFMIFWKGLSSQKLKLECVLKPLQNYITDFKMIHFKIGGFFWQYGIWASHFQSKHATFSVTPLALFVYFKLIE